MKAMGSGQSFHITPLLHSGLAPCTRGISPFLALLLSDFAVSGLFFTVLGFQDFLLDRK